MRRNVFEPTGSEIAAIIEHVEKQGLPKLRARRRTDLHTLEARPRQDGIFELLDPHFLEYVVNGTDWQTFAKWCDQDLWRIVQHLKRRNYGARLPASGRPPSAWPRVKVFEAINCLMPTIEPLIVRRLPSLMPTKVRCRDAAHLRPYPAPVREAFSWLAGAPTPFRRFPRPPKPGRRRDDFYYAPSAVAVSFLQLALDQADAKVHVRMEKKCNGRCPRLNLHDLRS